MNERNPYAAGHGVEMDLKRFHDETLSYGSPPTKFVRELMGVDR
jgi:uncharacterized protein (DUF885 family)